MSALVVTHRKVAEDTLIFAFFSFRSDKLRWISALSRPHPEIDFSAAQGMLLGLEAAMC